MDYPFELEPLNPSANEEPQFHSDDDDYFKKESVIEVDTKDIEGSPDVLEFHDEHEETENLISSGEEEQMKKKKSVSWIDEREETKDSVIFGAVTAIFVAPSSQEYDRSPSHRRKKHKRKHNLKRSIMLGGVCLGCLLLVGFAIFLTLLFGGFIRRGAT